MWTRKAIVYVGLGVTLVLFAPFINNLQLFLLGTTILAFVAVHSLVNTRPIDVKITRSFNDDQVFENSRVSIDLVIQNKGRPVGFLEIYDNLPSEVAVQSGLNHTVIRLKSNETVVNQYLLDCKLRGQFRLGNPRLRIYNPSFLFYYESEIESKEQIKDFLDTDEQAVVGQFERGWDKYRVSLHELDADVKKSEEVMWGYLKDLGYE